MAASVSRPVSTFLRTILSSFRRSAAVACCALSMGVPLAALLVAAGGCSTEGLITYAAESRQRGVELFNQANYADAAGAFQNAIKQDPRDYTSYYYLGRSYESQKQYHQAVQSYRTALDIMAESLRGREDVALRLKVLDGLASAAARGDSRELEQAALKTPRSPSAEDQFVLGKIYRDRGDVDSAIEAYGRAVQSRPEPDAMDPETIAIAKEYGLFLAQVGQKQKAGAQLTRAYVLTRRARQKDDPQVVAALRQVGVVPGPSLGEERDLTQPQIPVGPLPSAEDVANLRLQNPFVQNDAAPQGGQPTAGATAPRE